MKKIIILFVSVLVFASCTQPQKIAYVNTEKLIQDYEGTKKTEVELKQKQEEMQKQLQQLGAEYDTKLKKMSKRERKKNYVEFQKQFSQIQQQAQYNLQMESQKSIEAISKKVNDFVKEYAKKHQYNFVLGTVTTNGAVMYGDEKADITYDVLKELNKSFNDGDSSSKTTKEEKTEKETPTKKETETKSESKK